MNTIITQHQLVYCHWLLSAREGIFIFDRAIQKSATSARLQHVWTLVTKLVSGRGEKERGRQKKGGKGREDGVFAARERQEKGISSRSRGTPVFRETIRPKAGLQCRMACCMCHFILVTGQAYLPGDSSSPGWANQNEVTPTLRVASRVRFPVGSLVDLRMWELCRAMRLVGRISRGAPILTGPFIPALLHPHLTPPSSAFKNIDVKSHKSPHSMFSNKLARVGRFLTSGSWEPMREKRGGYDAAPECKSGGNEASSSMIATCGNPGNEPSGELNPVRHGGIRNGIALKLLLKNKHALDDSEPIADLQETSSVPYCHLWRNTDYSLGQQPMNKQLRLESKTLGSLREIRDEKSLSDVAEVSACLSCGGSTASVAAPEDVNYGNGTAACLASPGLTHQPYGGASFRQPELEITLPKSRVEEILTARNNEDLIADEGEVRRGWSSAEMQVWEKQEIPEETHRPVASSGTIPACENPGETRLGD
ncbi:hypothetical protein PR048_023195 [Dryococelus australis]|uniref:Uncharacterized protein n=1 Tax=Dryococelus australis TaxID=614101 RepID=A0ABQ9GTE5_9NEOP|nr:hypothetical protein PR048_023195 [Dryococelus australis]